MKSGAMKIKAITILFVMVMAAQLNAMTMLYLAGPVSAGKDEASKAYAKAYGFILNEQWSQAITALQGVSKQYSNSSIADDAAFYVCFAKEKTEKSQEAFDCYRQFVTHYLSSNYVNDATQAMVRLGNELKPTNPEIDLYIKNFNNSKDIDIKLLALQALLDSKGEKEALPVIIKLYDKLEKPADREKVLWILNDVEDPQVLVKMSSIVQTDPSVEIRKKAVYALGDHGPEATPELKKILASKNDIEVRKAALYALANSDDPSIAPFLGEVARTEQDVELAKAATFALADVDSPEAVQALQGILKSQLNLEVRKAALHTLADHGDGMSVATLKQVALNDSNEELRRTATYAIADDDTKEAFEALKEILGASKDTKVQEAALYAIADQQGTGASDVLMQTAINNPEQRLATAAVHALADATEGDTSLLLQVFQKSKFPEVRKAALFAIGDRNSKSAVDSLSKILKEEKEEEYRVTALYALGEVGDAAVPILSYTAQNDPSIRIRTAAVQMLGEIGTDAAKKELMKILEKE
ncbi:MAG TPA: HEAT repeat domain-containing protein [Acidobacteriota bacterium]|jgi:HEAT repeat protein|nr:HEAT repeat domain-containing protein [Acidobacteriota bacterium]